MKLQLQEIKFEVSYRCDLKCIHCSSEASASSLSEMSGDECFKLIEEASQMGVTQIAFSGGEPLLWPQIVKAVKIATQKNINVTIYSSGNAPYTVDHLLPELSDAGVQRFVFSLFGSTPETHEAITLTQHSFHKTISAVSKSLDLGANTEIHFVPLSVNYMELENVVKLSSKLGVSQVSVLRFVPQGRGKEIKEFTLNRDQNTQLKKTIINLREAGYKVRTGSPYNFLLLKSQPRCSAGVDKLTICPDLKLYPCDAFKKISAKNVSGDTQFSDLRHNSLQDCWERSCYLNTIRQSLQSPHAQPCKSCKVLPLCNSGCLAQKILHYGEITKQPDPQCLMT